MFISFYIKTLAPLRRIETGLRTKNEGPKDPGDLGLWTNLRDSERETTMAVPEAVKSVIVGVEPTTITAPVRAEQARNAVGILDGFMHRDDVPQTHNFQLLVRERVSDQAGDLPVRLEPTFLVSRRTNLLRDTVTVADLLAGTHHDVVGDAVGRRFAALDVHSRRFSNRDARGAVPTVRG